MQGLRLLRGRVQIRPDEEPKRIGSIIIPGTVVQKDPRNRTIPRTGVVMAMGAPRQTKHGHEVPHGFAVGDRVIYQYGQISTDGQDAWCAQDEILGVVE